MLFNNKTLSNCRKKILRAELRENVEQILKTGLKNINTYLTLRRKKRTTVMPCISHKSLKLLKIMGTKDKNV